MKSILLGLLTIIIFTLQLSFIPALRPFGVVPDVGLALVALVGLFGTASLALIVAIGGGLALDLASGTDFGLYVGLFALVALAAGFVHRAGLDSAGLLAAGVLVMVATLAGDVVILGGLVRVVSGWPVGHLLSQILIEMALNVAAMVLLRPIVRWLRPPDASQVMEVRS